MLLEKRPLSLDDLEAQTAFELPDRTLPQLVTIVITNLLNDLTIDIDVKNNNVALQVCAVVNALNAILVDDDNTVAGILVCNVEQNQ